MYFSSPLYINLESSIVSKLASSAKLFFIYIHVVRGNDFSLDAQWDTLHLRLHGGTLAIYNNEVQLIGKFDM